MKASQLDPPTYPYLWLYYLLLGMLVSVAFLIVSKRKGWGLFWRPFLTTLSIVAVGYVLGGLLHVPSNFQEEVLTIPLGLVSCILIQFYLFHIMAGPILVGVSMVGISVWFVRGIKSLKRGPGHDQDEDSESTETLQPISDLRYQIFLFGLLATTIMNIFVTYNLLKK